MKRIGIVTLAGDLHAIAVQFTLQDVFSAKCYLFEVDRVSGRQVIDWELGGPATNKCLVRDSQDEVIDITSLDVIWWRRGGNKQQSLSDLSPVNAELIEADSAAAWQGAFLTAHPGAWVSNPVSSALAENKQFQLKAARRAGFRVPDTLVSQDPQSIRNFYQRHNGKIIVKPVQGSRHAMIYTNEMTEEQLSNHDSLLACPAIYQELIPGTKHLRVAAFGKDMYAGLIETVELDWRSDVRKSISVFSLDQPIKNNISSVCDQLNLAMGVFDLKISESGEIVWFEVNPQGQFLFLQAETGLELLLPFATFLYEQAMAL